MLKSWKKNLFSVVAMSVLLGTFVFCFGSAKSTGACQFEGPRIMEAGNLIKMMSRQMIVEIDKQNGVLYSLYERKGKFSTNYLGNYKNVPGSSPETAAWTGNIISTVWKLYLPERPLVLIPSFSFRPSGEWREELTTKSSDIRNVICENETVRVEYLGGSKNEGGIKSYNLRMKYFFDKDGALMWGFEVENISEHILEIGELGLPLCANDFYRGVREKNIYINEVDDRSVLDEDERLKVKEMKIVHEERVVNHIFTGGHSSYALLERLSGDAPFLLVHPLGDTFFECNYRYESSGPAAGRQPRPYILAIHSWATKNIRRWESDWVNGHTSLILRPKEKKSFQLRFTLVNDYSEISEELYRSGNIGVRIMPSMVVPEGNLAYIEIKSRYETKEEFLSDNIFIKEKKRAGDKTVLVLFFKGRGQKSIKIEYNQGKWTMLHFYCTEPTAELIKARGEFIVDRQFYDNPSDPYGRHHMFLPFDYQTGSVFRDSDMVWEVGGSDEYGFSEALFLAEKNVYLPSKKEIEILEQYVNDCLFKNIQNPETYAIRASLYWKQRYPSSPWGHWNEERSKESYRTYNYIHAANIYHALYKIGKLYKLTSSRRPEEYLKMAYHTCEKLFNTGPWRHVGLMGGSNMINILNDLKQENLQDEYAALLKEMQKCNQVFVDVPYPYSSELFVDQTAHEQVYFFTRYFGETEKWLKTLQVIKALRGGNQPIWFRYGNDYRGDLACWYTESLNGLALLDGFEQTGDLDMFVKGYAGIMSVTANLLRDGMGFGQFISTPGIFAFRPPKTRDNGIGMYGFLKATKAYVIKDDSFGLIGVGCQIENMGDRIKIYPSDGLRKRVMFVDEKIGVEALAGEIESISYFPKISSFEVCMTDSTGLVVNSALIVRGLEKGRYLVTTNAKKEVVNITDSFKGLELRKPLNEVRLIKIEKLSD